MLTHDAGRMNNSVHPADVAVAAAETISVSRGYNTSKMISLKLIFIARAISEDNQDEICLADGSLSGPLLERYI